MSIDPTLSPHCIEHPEDVAGCKDTKKQLGEKFADKELYDLWQSECLTLHSIASLGFCQNGDPSLHLSYLS